MRESSCRPDLRLLFFIWLLHLALLQEVPYLLLLQLDRQKKEDLGHRIILPEIPIVSPIYPTISKNPRSMILLAVKVPSSDNDRRPE
jgi:hypothetical protein